MNLKYREKSGIQNNLYFKKNLKEGDILVRHGEVKTEGNRFGCGGNGP